MFIKAPIKDFAKVGAGQGAPQKETDFSSEGIPFIRAGSIEELLNGGDEMNLPKVNSEIAKQYRLKLYQPNTIVFAKSGMSAMKGRIYKLKNPCYVVNHLATLELKENAFPDFVVYLLRYFSPVKLINDISYPSLKQSKIETYEIPLPSRQDQIQIANLLSKAETLIEQRKQSIALLDEYLKSTFLEMFGDPITNKKNWEKVKLSSLGSIDRGVSKNRPRNAPELLGGKYPLIQTGEVTNSGLYITSFTKTYSEIGLKQSKLWEKETMLITIAANIARTSILSFKACFPDSIAGFIANKKETEIIFVHYLFIFFQKKLEDGASQTAQKNINLELLRNLLVPKPPIELQTQFANIVTKTETLKEQYKNSLVELENFYGSLSQKAFKGELVLHDITDESESFLLDHIKEEKANPANKKKIKTQKPSLKMDTLFSKVAEETTKYKSGK
jgi:type I restriction enzyme, S subunit